ncbi:MAG: phosphatase PAP2 family protein [bacterium]
MLNNQIFFTLYNLSHKSVFFDWVVIFIGNILPYLTVLAVIIFLLFHHEIIPSENPFKIFRQKWKEIVLIFFSGSLAWLLSFLLKLIIHLPRPFVDFPQVVPLFRVVGYAPPSGHATFYMALAFAIFFSHKKVGFIFMFIAFLIGIARVIAGVHFPVDILSGFILGAGIAYLVRFLYDKTNKVS